jgi:acylphosphatase
MAKERRMIHFVGTVQGVGFRYMATRVADDFGLGGYVQNLPDGSVQCLAEGDAAAIDAFIAELRERFGGYVREVHQQTEPYKGDLTSFGVKY